MAGRTHLTLGRALSHNSEDGAGSHVDWVQVGDGAAGDDVPSDRGRVADLDARKVLELLQHRGEGGRLVRWKRGNQLLQCIAQLGECHRCTHLNS